MTLVEDGRLAFIATCDLVGVTRGRAVKARELASRARGTPRIANRLLRRVRDYAQVRARGRVDLEATRRALELLNVDHMGLDALDRRLLEALVVRFGGGPVGLDSLATSLQEEPETIEDVYEPFLLQIGYLSRTPRGRVITPLGRHHIGAEVADGPGQQALF